MARQRPSEVPETRRASSADSILDAAESLFGRHGTEGVSLRQIGVAAGSSNHSAVQYHFNDRDGLIRGIFARRLPSLERARAQRLEQALQSGLGGDTGALLGALLLPIAGERDSAGQCSFAAFLLGFGLTAVNAFYRELKLSVAGRLADCSRYRLLIARTLGRFAVVCLVCVCIPTAAGCGRYYTDDD